MEENVENKSQAKYKLINTKTGEQHICDKVIIDGFDYYVSDTKIFELKPDDKYATIVENRRRIVFYTKHIQSKDNVVIATNNLNIDIPQILEEPNETLIHQIAADLGYRMLPDDLEEGIKAGYKESQETHPNSDEDMIEFAEWCQNQYFYSTVEKKWSTEFKIYDGVLYTTKELLKIWKEQQPKIVYYGTN